MLCAASLYGLTFRNDVDIDGDVNTAPITDSYKEFAYGLYSKNANPLFRKIGEDPEIRDDGTHSNFNETIGHSVFERWPTMPDYRPPNLLEWANCKKFDPAKLTNSVRADDPTVIAPE
jgi:hypothetical protein